MSRIPEDKLTEKPNRLTMLKLLIFLFFGALQCVYSYLPAHMEFLGFQRDEIRMLTMIASLVSIIGPLIVGFILDRVSINRPASYGKWLRVLLFICFVATGIFFGLLLSITPESYDVVDKRSSATFSCNENGGRLFVKRYLNESCDNVVEREGHLQLINCTYTCEMPGSFKNLNNPLVVTQHKAYPLLEKLQDGTQFSSEATPSDEEDYDENKSYDDENLPQPEAFRVEPTQPSHIHPPHICVSNGTNVNCLAYLDDSVIRLNSVEVSDDANRFDNNFCKRSLKNFTCHVPPKQVTWMKLLKTKENNSECVPAVECLIKDPHVKGSILEKGRIIIDHKVPYETYYPLRIIAEIFPIIIHMLLNIAVLVATRETSTGRGNVGHQWVFAPIGVLFFASILGVVNHSISSSQFILPFIVFSITMFVCAVVVLFSGKLPLTPTDWWWHTKCGLLAIPMSALKRYKWVIAAVAISAFILGSLWHGQEAFRHAFSIDFIEFSIIGGDRVLWRSKTFVYVIGSVLAIPLIWKGEKVVDCIGHLNIFILAFVSFALRYAGLYYDNWSEWSALLEILEPFSFYLPWLAFLLFMRHLVPKKFIAIGQALLVVLFFALGRGIGFFFGYSTVFEPKNLHYAQFNETIARQDEKVDLQNIHSIYAAIACAAALIYFIVYHIVLLPRYRVATNHLGTNNESNISPQRVFHDERSRKGYFRY